MIYFRGKKPSQCNPRKDLTMNIEVPYSSGSPILESSNEEGLWRNTPPVKRSIRRIFSRIFCSNSCHFQKLDGWNVFSSLILWPGSSGDVIASVNIVLRGDMAVRKFFGSTKASLAPILSLRFQWISGGKSIPPGRSLVRVLFISQRVNWQLVLSGPDWSSWVHHWL